eukprot:429835-Pelagomonas_calceolata.AAC.4
MKHSGSKSHESSAPEGKMKAQIDKRFDCVLIVNGASHTNLGTVSRPRIFTLPGWSPNSKN